jgi:ribosomal protein L11 methyltransferase
LNMHSDKYQKISIACNDDICDSLANYLTERSQTGVVIDDIQTSGETTVTAYIDPQKSKPFKESEIQNFLNELIVIFPKSSARITAFEYIPHQDWLEGWKKHFVPFHVTERIVIRPTWEHYSIQPGELEIIVDPKMAFGTGHHESTAQCLMALEKIGCFGKRVLDYGCGTGILAIAAAKLGASEVVGVDNDEEAIICARENIEINNVNVELVLSNCYRAVESFDIILANLSTAQIIVFYKEIFDSLRKNGRIVFSGIPDTDREQFLNFMLAKPLVINDELIGKEWLSYIAEKAR